MEFMKLLAFLCVSSCCAFAYALMEYRWANLQRKPRKKEGLVILAAVSGSSLMLTSLPLAYYALFTL